MPLNYQAFDEAIAERLRPVREILAGVPVSALPNKAQQLGFEEFEAIDWLFLKFSGIPRPWNSATKHQDIRMTLLVRLAFDYRYAESPEEKRVLEWAEQTVLGLLVCWRIPGANTDLEIDPGQGGQIFPPTEGRWLKELRFVFETTVVQINIPDVQQPKVKLIRTRDRSGILSEVTKK